MSELVGKGSKYSDEDRRRAVIEYSVHGVMSKVSDLMGIPETTLSSWKNNTDWWYELTTEVRSEIEDRLLAQNLQIATRAGQVALDSLENGDEKLVFDKNTGEYVIKHVKLSGKDAAIIGGIYQDKARVQLNLPTSVSSSGSIESLKALAQKFEQLARDNRVIAVQKNSEEVE